MRDDILYPIRVPDDHEIKSPLPVDTGLPQVSAFVVFLGSQRRVMEIVGEEAYLFLESSPNRRWRIFERLNRAIRNRDRHNL